MARTYDLTGTLGTGITATALPGGNFAKSSLGVTVTATTSVPSFLLTDLSTNPLTNETDSNQWLVVRAMHNAGVYMGVYFGPVTIDAEEPTYSFPIRPDNEMHTYNLWLGRYYLAPRKQLETEASFDPCINEGVYPAFTGNQSKLVSQTPAFLPNLVGPITVFINDRFANHSAEGSWGRVEFIKIADKPEGPTVLIIDMLCCARAICRVDEPTPCGIRIRNMGSIAATGIEISFTSVSPEVTCGGVYGIPDSIPAGEERTAYFMFTCTDHSAFFSVDVTVTCIQPDSVTKRLRVWVDDTVPAFTPNAVPTPQIIPFNRKKSRVGVWYFAVWNNVDMFHTISTISSFERRPIDGYSADTDPNTLAWHIYYLVSRGVDYLAVEWFDKKPVSKAFMDQSLTQCSHMQYVKFLFSYINHDGVFLSSTVLRKNPDGNTPTMRSGVGAPVNGLPGAGTGVEYDFYRDTTNRRLYGPKGPVNWPTTYVQFPTTATHGDVLLSSNTDRRLIYCANFISLMATWCPYLAHTQYLKNASGQRELWIYFMDQFYEQVNNLSGVIEATTYSDNRDALVGSLLDRAEAVILDYGLTGGVEWGCPVNKYQGGNGLDGGALLNTRYASWGFKKSNKYNFYAGGSRYQRISAEVTRNHYANVGWNSQANQNGITPALAIIAGFGNHRWYKPYQASWVITDWTYEHMLAHCQAAMTYQDTNISTTHGHPNRDLIIDAATEYGEGSILLPSAEYQTKLGDALFEAVVSGVAMLPLLSPNDVYTSPANWPNRIANIHDWVQFPTAEPEFNDGETHTKQGITIPLGLSPAIEPANAVGGWIET